MSYRGQNLHEGYMLDKLSDKIEYQKPISDVVAGMMNPRNRRGIMLAMSQDKELCESLSISEDKRKLLSRKANYNYTEAAKNDGVDIHDEDELTAFLDEYEDKADHVTKCMKSDFEKFGYERNTEVYNPKRHLEDKFHAKLNGPISAEGLLMNRIIEGILGKVLQDTLRKHPQIGNEYLIHVQNTSTFDDIISGTDLIVRARDKYSGQYHNIAIDVACTNSLEYVEKKERQNNAGGVICGDFGSTLGKHGSFRKMPRLVFPVSPGIVAKVVDAYVDEILAGNDMTTVESVAGLFAEIESQSLDDIKKFENGGAHRVSVSDDLLSALTS